MSGLKILFAASEAAPFVKTGGLGDVAAALPKTLGMRGNDVRVVLPCYRQIKLKYRETLRHLHDFNIKLGWRNQYCGIETMTAEGVTYYFIDNEYYFGRDYIYGVFCTDEAERFGFFAKAVLELMEKENFFPDVLQLNDWQTAMAAPLLKTQYADKSGYAGVKTLMTIHNLRFQGVFDMGFCRELLSLDDEVCERSEYYSCINFLKAALMYSDRIVTVSPTYAEEILTAYYGESMDGVLRERNDDLSGILNGIDTAVFDPARDPAIPANYNRADLLNKKVCKKALQLELGLEVRQDVPVIAIVSRLTGQKGLDLVAHVADEIMAKDVEFVVLGTGEARFEQVFVDLAGRWPGRAAVRLKYDEGLSRRIYAAADLFLVPSQFEPCGLTQMISMRYGAIPVVRETGGLKDSVEAYNKFEDKGNGFSFRNYNAHELLYTVQHAVDMYRDEPRKWYDLVQRAMAMDFSWNESAGEYEKLYNSMIRE